MSSGLTRESIATFKEMCPREGTWISKTNCEDLCNLALRGLQERTEAMSREKRLEELAQAVTTFCDAEELGDLGQFEVFRQMLSALHRVEATPTPESAGGDGFCDAMHQVRLKAFKQGVAAGERAFKLAHERAFDAWSTASELLHETYEENRQLKEALAAIRTPARGDEAVLVEAVKAGINAALEAVRHVESPGGQYFANAILKLDAKRFVPAAPTQSAPKVEAAPASEDGEGLTVKRLRKYVVDYAVAKILGDYEAAKRCMALEAALASTQKEGE